MVDLETIAESDAHARWIVDNHGASVRFGMRPRCTICEQWWPCDLASLAALAVLNAEKLKRVMQAALGSE
jgi:hypothetical protein